MTTQEDVDLSVIIVNYNTRDLLLKAISYLQAATSGLRTQIVLIDNASRDGSPEYIQSMWPQYELIANSTNLGFGRANNQALRLLRGRHVLLLNTDAFVALDSVRVALRCLEANPRAGIVGVRLTDTSGNAQPSCRYFPTPWSNFLTETGLHRVFASTQLVDDIDWDDRRDAECDWVPGAFFLMKRAVIDQVGLFDPRFFLYCEEVDLCKAAKAAGWSVLYCAGTSVVHIGGESAKSDGKLSSGRQLSALQAESELLYYRKHYGLMGLMWALSLGLLTDLILLIKGILGRGAVDRRPFDWIRTYIVLAGATRLGTRPTR